MSKKICILNGSPRPNGNTKALITHFIKGAEASGNEVICFDLQKMNIHGCSGCCNGGKDTASPCVQKDDMQKIYPTYKDADIVVLASPMYYWGISGQRYDFPVDAGLYEQIQRGVPEAGRQNHEFRTWV